MGRRICLAATVVGAAPLALGVAVASAAPAKPAKPKPIVLKCNVQLTAAPLAGTNVVDQPPTSGWMYGSVGCPKPGYGGGIEASSFTVPLSGDTVGSFTQYLSAGAIKGKFDLVPQEVSSTSSFFASDSWTGTLTVTGGTGVYKGIKSKKDVGTMTCTSTDTVHLVCTEKVRVTPGLG